MSIDDVGEIGQFLSSILLLQGIQDVSAEDKAILLQHLPMWEQKYHGRLASDTAGRCLGLLTNDPSVLDRIYFKAPYSPHLHFRGMRQMIDGVKNMLESKLDKCGGPGCVRRIQKDGSVLLQCGRYVDHVFRHLTSTHATPCRCKSAVYVRASCLRRKFI